MSTIHILTKQGKMVKVKTLEDVAEIWNRINGDYGLNGFYNNNVNREHMLVTDIKGRPMVFNKRYILKITNDTTP